MNHIFKYPRTPHIEGSCKQHGDEDLKNVPFEQIKGKYVVIEEKVDGANSGISVINDQLLLQSRGHYLTGGYREKHFDLFKTWAYTKTPEFIELLGERYILYGEWLFAKHTMYYDNLPHYFMEFDILDLETNLFLSTKKRREMLSNYPFIFSVKVLFEGIIEDKNQLYELMGKSHFITDNFIQNLEISAKGLDIEKIKKETNLTQDMEGLYIKVEDGDSCTERYKFVRDTFLQNILESETHWLDRPIVPNKINKTIEDLF